MPPRWDLLAIDLDGTLLGPDGLVPGREADAVDRARRAGIEVVLATGRNRAESAHAVTAVDHTGYLITASGAMTTHVADDRTVRAEALDLAIVHLAAETLLDDGHHVLLLKDDIATGCDYVSIGPHALDPASVWWMDRHPVRRTVVDSVHDDPHPESTVRVSAVAAGLRLVDLAARLEARLGGRAFLHHWGAVTSSHATRSPTHILEVFGPEVDKWPALERLCAEIDVDPARTVAIGDGLNDVGMVRGAGLGIAMANADPRVHAVADATTGDHGAGGVADAIDRLLDGRW